MSAAVSAELCDVIAYLRQRAAAADAAARKDADFDVLALDRRRQAEVIIDDLRAGLHHGCVDLRAGVVDANGKGQDQ